VEEERPTPLPSDEQPSRASDEQQRRASEDPPATGSSSKVAARRGRRRGLTAGRLIAVTLLVALLGVFAIVAAEVGSGKWEIQPVLSGSMRPGFPIGGVVVAQRVPTASLQVRDVILFHPPGEPQTTYVHRIISLERVAGVDVVRTQGDDNRFPDSWTLHLNGRWAYEARFTIPLLGYVAVWDHSGSGRRDLLDGAGALIVLCGIMVLASHFVRGKREATTDGKVDVVPASADQEPVAGVAGVAGGRQERARHAASRRPERRRRRRQGRDPRATHGAPPTDAATLAQSADAPPGAPDLGPGT
jgi:signal peptidase I